MGAEGEKMRKITTGLEGFVFVCCFFLLECYMNAFKIKALHLVV